MTDAKSDKPRFSKKAVNRAGERLVVDPTDEEALEVLDYWRGLHAKPLEKCLPWIEKIRENIQIDCRQLKHRGEPADEWTSISSRL